jgi:hypothetical protein
MKLEWKNPKIDGYPTKPGAPCFIDVSGLIQIAYWQQAINEWNNSIYGLLPRLYDDEGTYPPEVKRWAYIPKELLDLFNEFQPCSAYQPNYYKYGDACFGTKERESCTCGGNKLKCNFY